MSLLIAIIVIAIFQLAGLCIMVWFLQKSLAQQNKTVQLLAMFKKARDPGDVAAMVDLTEQLGDKPETVEVVPEEAHLYPHELGNDALSEIRKQM